nr:hypothetical protein [Actinomycetota bacterium]
TTSTTTRPPTTTTRPPTATTTPPPTATTTILTTTTTTAPPPQGPTCNIAPANGQAAIEAAIAACPNGAAGAPTLVSFPTAASYTINGTIKVDRRSHLVIDGNGSTFRNTAPNVDGANNPHWRVLEGRDLTFREMTVLGNFTSAGPRGITSGNQFNHGFNIYGGNGIVVEDSIIRDVFGDGVTTSPSGFITGGGALGGEVPTNVRFSRLTISRTARMCAGITAAKTVAFEDSSCTNIFYGGIDLEIDVAGEPLQNIKVLRNTIDGVFVSAIMAPQGGNPGDLDGIEIRGNKLLRPPDTCYPPILVLEANREAGGARNVVVADNTLKTLQDGVKFRSVQSGSVTGNNISLTVSPNYCGPPTAVPIRLVNSPNVAVSANTSSGY